MRDLSTLKLCFLAGTLGHGGAERQLYYILQSLCAAGANPRLLTLDQGGFWQPRIRDLGVRVTHVGAASRGQRMLRILKELRNDRPDILQSQHFYTNAYLGVAAWILQLNGIGAMRNDGTSEVKASGRIGGWMSLHLPRTLAANSQLAIRYATANGVPASRLYFLPNVVDSDRFQPAVPRLNGPLTLVAVGRLVKQKRLDRFISLLARLRADHGLDVRGLIVGAGSRSENLRPQLEAQAMRLGLLQDVVQFRGAVADMRSVYQEAAMCVLTSDFEGTPNVLLEAMASGLPVLAARVGGVPDIVQHGKTGFLFEPDDLNGFARSVVELAKNPSLRMEMGQRARAFVEERHGRARLPAYLGDLYQRVLQMSWQDTAQVVPGTSS